MNKILKYVGIRLYCKFNFEDDYLKFTEGNYYMVKDVKQFSDMVHVYITDDSRRGKVLWVNSSGLDKFRNINFYNTFHTIPGLRKLKLEKLNESRR